MNETSKAAPRRAVRPLFQRAFSGRGIDIGGGGDPLQPVTIVGGRPHRFMGMVSCECFDMRDGDANVIDTLRPHESYDFVYSSQTLEDMDDPFDALSRWSRLVKPGGYMVITVPDFELYERGHWPSIGNGAHRSCFGMNHHPKAPVNAYYNLSLFLDGFTFKYPWQLLLLQLVDTNYDYSPEARGRDQTLGNAEAFLEFVLRRNL